MFALIRHKPDKWRDRLDFLECLLVAETKQDIKTLQEINRQKRQEWFLENEKIWNAYKDELLFSEEAVEFWASNIKKVIQGWVCYGKTYEQKKESVWEHIGFYFLKHPEETPKHWPSETEQKKGLAECLEENTTILELN